ncbi:MAG: hypothetical protein JWN71_1119 [Xanthobacteraceae bacterium]|nr:hypothetical protein [Xanthobacteraceae bacterium]
MSGRAATEGVILGRCGIAVGDPQTELPTGWSWAPLLLLAELGTGHTPSRKHPEYWGSNIPWIGIRDAGAHHGGVIYDTLQHVTELGLQKSSARLLPKDTICLSRTASVGYVVRMGREMSTSQDFVAWSCGDFLDPAFLMKALLAEGEEIRRFGEGSTHTTIYFPEVKAFHIALPPPSEQRRVVAKIDNLSGKSKRARDHLDHIPRLVEKYKLAILTAAFKGELTREWRTKRLAERWPRQQIEELEERRREYLRGRRGSRLLRAIGDAEQPQSIPEGWLSANLADVGSLQVGYAYKSKWYANVGVPLLRGANIAPGKVTWDDVVRLPHERAAEFSEYALNVGDIVIAMDRPLISTGLKVARIEPSDAGCLLVQRVARYVPSSLVDRTFIWHVINSPLFIEHAVAQATGSDLPHISSNDILTTPLALPPPTEQREIARLLDLALAWVDRVASEATNARKLIDRLDQAILAKAFQGELVPQDPNDEPASVLLKRIRAERATASAQSQSERGRRKREAGAA